MRKQGIGVRVGTIVLALLAGVGAALLVAISAGGTSDASRAEGEAPTERLEAAFTRSDPAGPLGLQVRATFDGERVIDAVRFQLPAGTRFDPTAIEACVPAAPDVPVVCPPATQVGAGLARGRVGRAEVTLPVVAYNGGARGMLLTYGTGRPPLLADAIVAGRQLTVPLDAAKGLGARLTRLELSLDEAAGPDGRPYVVLPRGCPSSGFLTVAVRSRSGERVRETAAAARCPGA